MPENRGGPEPLRDAKHLFGLPKLSVEDRLRVDKANDIYHNVSRIIDLALQYSVLVVMENPCRSWLWEFPWYAALLKRGFIDIDFQHCKWTRNIPSRAKWTKLRSNCLQLAELQGPCNQSHVPLGWGQKPSGAFATEGEAEYPVPMCEAIADSLVKAVKQKFPDHTSQSSSTLKSDISTTPHAKRARVVGGKQPRGKAVPSVVSVSEFAEIRTVTLAEAFTFSLQDPSACLREGDMDAVDA